MVQTTGTTSTVTGEAPVVDVQTVRQQAVLDTEELDVLPVGNYGLQTIVGISAEVDHRCRPKWITGFGRSGSPVSAEVDRRFRPKWITFGRSGSVPVEVVDHPVWE